MAKFLILLFSFLSSFLCAQYFKDYKSISTANQEEKEMYALLKEIVLATSEDSSDIHFFPLYFISEKKEEVIFRSYMYAEPEINRYTNELKSATYWVSLAFPFAENLEDENLIGLANDPEIPQRKVIPQIKAYRSKEKMTNYSKPFFSKEVDSLLFNKKYDLEKVIFQKNTTYNLIDTSYYKGNDNSIKFISKDYLISQNKNKFYGITTSENKIILPFEYNSIEPYIQGFLVKKENSAYYVDSTGKRISNEYENISPLSGISTNLADFQLVKKNNKATLINTDFKELLPFYDRIRLSHLSYNAENERLIIENDGKMFLFNPNLWKEVSNKYDKISPLDKSSHITENQHKIGLIDNDGKVILENKYDTIVLAESYNYPDHRILFIKKNKLFAIFKNDKQITEFEFETVKDLLYGKLFVVSRRGKYGIIKANTEIFVPLKYKSEDFIKQPEIEDLLRIEIEKHNR